VANVPVAKVIQVKLVDLLTCKVKRPWQRRKPLVSGTILRNAAFRRVTRQRTEFRCSAQ